MLFAAIDRWQAPAPAEAKVGWLAQHIYAHRGLHGAGVPENSPTAFAGAVTRGLGIECDVQRSGDGQAVVFHDWDLERLTGHIEALVPEWDLAPAVNALQALRGVAVDFH